MEQNKQAVDTSSDVEIFCISDLNELAPVINGNDPAAQCHGFFINRNEYNKRPDHSRIIALIATTHFVGLNIETGCLSVLTTSEGVPPDCEFKHSILFGGTPNKSDITNDVTGVILSESNPLFSLGVKAVYTMNREELLAMLMNTSERTAKDQLGTHIDVRSKKYKFPSFFFKPNVVSKEGDCVVLSNPYIVSVSGFNQLVIDTKVEAGGLPPYLINVFNIDLNTDFFEQVYQMNDEELSGLYSRHMFSLPYENFKKKIHEEKELSMMSFIVLENLIFSMVMRIQMVLDYKKITDMLVAQEDKFI